jgi:hypothetical protein
VRAFLFRSFDATLQDISLPYQHPGQYLPAQSGISPIWVQSPQALHCLTRPTLSAYGQSPSQDQAAQRETAQFHSDGPREQAGLDALP